MGLEMGEAFGFIAMFDVANACFKLEETLEEVYDLVETSLDGLYDVFMTEESSSLSFDNSVLPNPLYHSHISSTYSLPFPCLEYYMPIDNPMIFYANNYWAMSITCLVCLVGILIILYP